MQQFFEWEHIQDVLMPTISAPLATITDEDFIDFKH